MKPILQTYEIKAPVSRVWQALTDPKTISRWSGDAATMSDKKDDTFSLWGGSIWGKNIQVVPNQKLVQEWFSDEDPKWEKPSIVTFTVSEKNGTTTLILNHENVPEQNMRDISDGWKKYYMGPLKKLVERKV